MKTYISNSLKLAIALLMVAAMFGGVLGASAASLPASSCTSSAGVATCSLYATTGTATLYGSTAVNIWGFSATNAAGSASLPGPTLIVNQGDTVTINLTNIDIPEGVSMNFQGQNIAPDLSSGVSAGGSKSYTFTASHPGTFLYEAGLAPGKQHQTAMGMYGALIVKPADGTAYGTAGSSFNEETLLVLSEIDPVLNSSATPWTFEMRNYAPKYFLINGKAYASSFTGDIGITAGNTVLLRYVNAGMQAHAMSTLGIAQKVIATDGYALSHPHFMIGETIATGQTLDTLVAIPAGTADGTKFAVYDANAMLRNANASGLGGMLTFLTVGAITPPPTDNGPVVSNLALSPNPTNGSVIVTVSATITDSGTTATNISAAEFYIDSTAGSPTAMNGTFNASPTTNVSGTISIATLAGLTSGNHTIYVRGKDSASPNNLWGPFLSITLNLDKTGPTTSGLSLTPNPSSGAVSVALAATGNDTASGNSNVTAAEYWVDGGVHTAMTASGIASPTRNFTATIPAGLSMGMHVVSVRSQDAFGNWGAVATINLQVADVVGPATSNTVANPNPNNGSMPFNTSIQAVRVTADFSDASSGGSNLAGAEGFVNSVAGNTTPPLESSYGTGFVFIANDGTFNSVAESGYSDIPLAVVGTLTAGSHNICIHAKDSAGNWGPMNCTLNLSIDKTPPTVVSITRVTATPTNASSVQWLVTFSESVTGVSASNFGLTETLSGSTTITSVTGTGATRTVTATTGSGNGTIRLNLTSATNIKDLATNAMTSAGLPFAGETYTLDRTSPSVSSVTRVNSNPTNLASVQFTVTFSEAVNGGTTSNFSLTTTGVTGASITSVSGSGSTRTVTVNTGSGSGSIRLNVANGTGITDLVGNTLNGSFPVSGGTSGTYTIDKTAPTVSSINRANTNPTTASSVSFTVTFSESMTGVSTSNFALTTTGTYSVAPTITSISGTGSTRTVTINTGTNSGAGTHTIRLDMVNSTGATDAAGNAVNNVPYTSGQAYTKN